MRVLFFTLTLFLRTFLAADFLEHTTDPTSTVATINDVTSKYIDGDIVSLYQRIFVNTKGSQAIMNLTAENFNYLKQVPIAIVRFASPYCGHCKRQTPEYRAAAEAYGSLKENFVLPFFEVNVVEEIKVTTEQAITGVPTVALYEYGNKTGTMDRNKYHSIEDYTKDIISHANLTALPNDAIDKIEEMLIENNAEGTVKAPLMDSSVSRITRLILAFATAASLFIAITFMLFQNSHYCWTLRQRWRGMW